MGDRKREESILISYDTLFELLRREKIREELQSLPKGFIEVARRFLQEKRSSRDPEQLTSYDAWESGQLEIQNIFRILRELYDRREKKILQLALIRSRTAASIVDMNAFLPHEIALFEEIATMLERRRLESYAALPFGPARHSLQREQQSVMHREAGETGVHENAKLNKEVQTGQKSVRIRLQEALPKFVGPNLDIYGPYAKDTIVELPETIATVLLEKNHALPIGAHDEHDEKGEDRKEESKENRKDVMVHEASQDSDAPLSLLPEAHGA